MIVVKLGGSSLEHADNVISDLKNERFVLVHGFGPQVDEMTRTLGKEPRWVTCAKGVKSRYTDQETVKTCCMVASWINSELVRKCWAHGISAIGMSGWDGQLVTAKRKARIKIVEDSRKLMLEGDYTGKVETVNEELLKKLLENHNLVLSNMAMSLDHEPLNLNADRLAANIANALRVETLINLSNIPGVLQDEVVVPSIKYNELEDYMKKVSGGMVMKLFSVKEAFEFGIKKVIIAPANIENPITKALAGEGTVIRNE